MGATLSPFRYTLRTCPAPIVKLTSHEGPIGAMAESAARARAERDGTIFRETRIRFGLKLEQVAQGWEVSAVLVGELERGHLAFPETDDLYAATQQLWLWHMEAR